MIPISCCSLLTFATSATKSVKGNTKRSRTAHFMHPPCGVKPVKIYFQNIFFGVNGIWKKCTQNRLICCTSTVHLRAMRYFVINTLVLIYNIVRMSIKLSLFVPSRLERKVYFPNCLSNMNAVILCQNVFLYILPVKKNREAVKNKRKLFFVKRKHLHKSQV